MNDILKKLRKYEVHIRKAVNTRMHGDFHSIFKGSGLEFADVRDYQYGDDVRTIDWNVSAKGHGTFVKNFREEKEQIIFFLLDVSASQYLGDGNKKKITIANEICGVLTLSAIKESGHVGLICFSDQKELYIKPGKGLKHAYQLILKLFDLQPQSKKTDLNKAILYTLSVLKRKSVLIFISDFIDESYEKNLIALSKKHDLVLIHISDNREREFPRLGIIPIIDKETGKKIWINSFSKNFQKKIKDSFSENKSFLENFSNKHNADYLWINSEEEYVSKLIKLFRVRNKSHIVR
ncbi:MAG: DUF58 domain-containing protein [Cytophagaceae bacterium]|nr:DUF58 domain-containing protein [Cytophagaceae bacterium]MDW8455510.1 DUF58 domain-containing protein [Cytophagaceae bacterium]